MTAVDRLARSYRRLMWAYPRWYRRERGAELLTTLLDAAGPGQERPSGADVRDLVAGGIRARLRPPRSAVARIVAGHTALYLAVAGAAFGVVVGGHAAPPDEGRSIAAATLATGQAPREVPGPVVACDTLCPDPVAGDDVTAYRRPWDHTDTVRVDYHPAAGQVSTVVAGARERLAAAGWRVGGLRVQDDGTVWFTASDGSLDLSVTGVTVDGPAVIVVADRSVSARPVVLLAAGSVAGLVAGWLVAVWALQRVRRHRAGRRLAVGVLAAPYVVLGLFASLSAVWVSAVLLAGGQVKGPLVVLPDPATPYWPALAAVALAGTAALVLAVLPGPAPEPDRSGVRIA